MSVALDLKLLQTGADGATPITLEAENGAALMVPGGNMLLDADLVRLGSDLILSGEAGASGIGSATLNAVYGSGNAAQVSGTAGVLYEFAQGNLGLSLDFAASTTSKILSEIQTLLARNNFSGAALTEGSNNSKAAFVCYEAASQGETADALTAADFA